MTMRTLLVIGLLAAATVARAGTYYVATNGSDAWSGRQPAPVRGAADGPFATLQRARDAVRAGRRGAADRATVVIRGGTYRITDTLQLGAGDSRTVWQAAKGETVRLVGGARLANWNRVTDPAVLDRLPPAARDAVRQVDLRAAGVTDLGLPTPVGGPAAQLVAGTHYMTLARYPNEGQWLRITGIPKGGGPEIVTEYDNHYGRFAYSDDRPAGWKNAADLWMHGYWVWDWSEQYQRVAKLDLQNREISPEQPYHGYGYRKDQRFYFLNVLEELDAPGEFYIDRAAGLLYLWPTAALETAEVFFPELQKPMIAVKGARGVQIRGLTMECSRDQAVVIEGGDHNEIAGCTIRNFGAHAAVTVGGTDSGVRSCDVYEVAGAGIQLDGGDRKTLTPGRNYVLNCDIHHVARVYRTYHGAVSVSGVGQRIAHCSIHDMPHQGIGHAGNDHIIEYCDFTRIATETGDVGVTYDAMDWTYMGNEFRYNYFHGIHAPGHIPCFTVYTDLPCGGIHLHHNIFYDVDHGYYTNSGRGMLIENNLFVKCGRTFGFGTWPTASMFKEGGSWRMVERLREVAYDRPPYSTRYPALKRLAADFALGEDRILERERPRDNLIRRNVSWGQSFLAMWPNAGLEHVVVEQNVIADDVVFDGAIDGGPKTTTYRNGDPVIAAELGKRGNVIVRGNPGIRDAAKGDFRFLPGSPARAIRFDTIPLARIGLYRDTWRPRLPQP